MEEIVNFIGKSEKGQELGLKILYMIILHP